MLSRYGDWQHGRYPSLISCLHDERCEARWRLSMDLRPPQSARTAISCRESIQEANPVYRRYLYLEHAHCMGSRSRSTKERAPWYLTRASLPSPHCTSLVLVVGRLIGQRASVHSARRMSSVAYCSATSIPRNSCLTLPGPATTCSPLPEQLLYLTSYGGLHTPRRATAPGVFAPTISGLVTDASCRWVLARSAR